MTAARSTPSFAIAEKAPCSSYLCIGGVPCFVANMRAAVSGAQDVATMKAFLDDVAVGALDAGAG